MGIFVVVVVDVPAGEDTVHRREGACWKVVG